MTFNAFDEISPHIKSLPYKERINNLRNLQQNKHFKVVQVTRCDDRNDLIEKLTKIVYEGGEGLILRDPLSLYDPGRTDLILKVKVRN